MVLYKESVDKNICISCKGGGKCMGDDKAQKRKVQITSIITLFVFLLDIYLIIYVPTDYILATAAFVTLVFAIFTLNSWLKLLQMMILINLKQLKYCHHLVWNQ